MQALCVPAARKSMEPLSARADLHRHTFHQFITESPWSWAAVQDRLVEVGRRRGVFNATEAGLHLDETSAPKSAPHSVGAARQHCGALGKVANCQVIPTLVWAPTSPHHRDTIVQPLAARLNLPETWPGDPARRERAGVPEDVAFRTKRDRPRDAGRWLCARAHQSGAPPGDGSRPPPAVSMTVMEGAREGSPAWNVLDVRDG